MATTLFQLVSSFVSSQVASISHWRRCYGLIPEWAPERFRKILHTAQAISSLSEIEYSPVNGYISMGIGCPRGGACRYRASLSAVMVVMVNLDVEGGEGRYGIPVPQ